MTGVKPVPDDYPAICPYLLVAGARDAIAFYSDVFGAVERMRLEGPHDTIGHAELAIGDSVLMLADEHPDVGIRGPRAFGGSPVMLSVYVDDVDAAIARALAAGATLTEPIEDRFYGDRAGQIEDPFGHRWSVQTHVEDVAEDELRARAAALASG